MAMSDDTGGDRPRRAKNKDAPEMPSGYRASRRGSRAAKQAKRAIRQHKVVSRIDTFGRVTKNVLYVAGAAVAAVAVLALVVTLAVVSINGIARWSAKRSASTTSTTAKTEKATRENLLIIAVDQKKATGFLAVRIDTKERQVYGIAIPDGAFIEVPGQGFERVGDSYLSGPGISMSAISNFLTVTFRRYVVVPSSAYQEALRSQSMVGVMDAVTDTNLTDAERASIASTLEKTESKDVALAPLQVKPITVGEQTYFEPQRDKLASLLKSWWGVTLSDSENVTRLIVYNGSGVPGIAGEAAQQLIRGGFRVVDTKNADKFTYKTTQIVVQNGDMTAGDQVRNVLKVGKVVNQPGEQDVADVIVIIGTDYKPPATNP